MLNIDRQPDMNKEKKTNLVSKNKTGTYSKNAALQITFYQWLNDIYDEKDTGWVGRGFLFCLFVLFVFLV